MSLKLIIRQDVENKLHGKLNGPTIVDVIRKVPKAAQ
jgi:hypothetical protein